MSDAENPRSPSNGLLPADRTKPLMLHGFTKMGRMGDGLPYRTNMIEMGIQGMDRFQAGKLILRILSAIFSAFRKAVLLSPECDLASNRGTVKTGH
jgi:hypothetical protein